SPLDATDYDALAKLMGSIDGLMMFNGGTIAGASQPHRHFHLMPGLVAPIAAAFPHGETDHILPIEPFRFMHAFQRLDRSRIEKNDAESANYLRERMEAGMEHCGLHPT